MGRQYSVEYLLNDGPYTFLVSVNIQATSWRKEEGRTRGSADRQSRQICVAVPLEKAMPTSERAYHDVRRVATPSFLPEGASYTFTIR